MLLLRVGKGGGGGGRGKGKGVHAVEGNSGGRKGREEVVEGRGGELHTLVQELQLSCLTSK